MVFRFRGSGCTKKKGGNPLSNRDLIYVSKTTKARSTHRKKNGGLSRGGSARRTAIVSRRTCGHEGHAASDKGNEWRTQVLADEAEVREQVLEVGGGRRLVERRFVSNHQGCTRAVQPLQLRLEVQLAPGRHLNLSNVVLLELIEEVFDEGLDRLFLLVHKIGTSLSDLWQHPLQNVL